MPMLTDASFTIPPVPGGGPSNGIRWLRRSVARFTDGPDHTRRRGQAEALLAGVNAAALRRAAADRTRAILDAADGPVDLMAEIARVVPVTVLNEAASVSAVAAVAKCYQPGPHPDEPADAAVAELIEVMGGTADEDTACRIALLAQAFDATAGLVGNAALTLLRQGDRSPADVVAATLRDDPPVRATRRAEPGTGTVVTVDLAASGRPFGAGPHQCPGQAHAVAIAEGILDALRGCRLTTDDVVYVPSPVLRIPAKLVCLPPGRRVGDSTTAS